MSLKADNCESYNERERIYQAEKEEAVRRDIQAAFDRGQARVSAAKANEYGGEEYKQEIERPTNPTSSKVICQSAVFGSIVVHNRATTLPSSAADRKEYPIATGVLDYFPDAIAAIAHLSFVGNQQHNPGQPLHWAREKSTDQDDTLIRHFLERGKVDVDGVRHSTKLAWRALALLQLEIEGEGQ